MEKPGINTLFDLFENSVNKHGARKCLGWRPMKNGKAGDFQWLTYKETQGVRQSSPPHRAEPCLVRGLPIPTSGCTSVVTVNLTDDTHGSCLLR